MHLSVVAERMFDSRSLAMKFADVLLEASDTAFDLHQDDVFTVLETKV